MNGEDLELEITNHVCKRYIQRFNPQLDAINDFNDRLIAAKKAIIAILNTARYLSDDHRGILLKSSEYKCFLIIRNKTLVTIYPEGTKRKYRERKYNQECA